MNRRSLSLIPLAIVLAGPLIAASVQAGAVAPLHASKAPRAPLATGQHAPSSKMPQLAPLSALAGYTQVSSALLTDGAGMQTSGTAVCPANTMLVGGGAVISGSGLGENLNSSVPLTDTKTWKAWVNNASSTTGTFKVYADCVKKVAKYSVVISSGLDNPSGAQSSVSVLCPQGTFPLGGGGLATSGLTSVNLNSSIPLAKGWRTDVNNASSAGNTITAYAVCGKKPSGYAQVAGSLTSVSPSAQGDTIATCPAGTLVLGGGSLSSSGSTAVNINSQVPSGATGWHAYENNSTTGTTSMTAYAVCATAH